MSTTKTEDFKLKNKSHSCCLFQYIQIPVAVCYTYKVLQPARWILLSYLYFLFSQHPLGSYSNKKNKCQNLHFALDGTLNLAMFVRIYSA